MLNLYKLTILSVFGTCMIATRLIQFLINVIHCICKNIVDDAINAESFKDVKEGFNGRY